MHLAGDYTPALHMSSNLSFKSSLQEDRTKHRDNHSQRRKHKIIKRTSRLAEAPAVNVCKQWIFVRCATDRRLPG